MEGRNTEELVAVELDRFKNDEARIERMTKREALIKQETSEIKKTLLMARQFLDEVT